jgi:DNA/RNA-binding domain of Phe-tRNA-synthetase-like protein
MNGVFVPFVAPDVWARYPDYRAFSVMVQNFRTAEGQVLQYEKPAPPQWMEGHLEAWRNVFRGFGANPKKTPCSVEALWRRFQKTGTIPTIDPVVDLYNALSIRFGAPFGGEDAERYAGAPQLGFASGTESFDTVRDGAPVLEHPEPGEVIWRDEVGVTCRKWNWRQCRRTALRPESTVLWFVIDRLSPMPIDELKRAGDALVKELRAVCPGVETSMSLLEPGV